MKDKFIVAIGSSAGGLNAMRLFFDSTPNDHATYVILRHLPINYKSQLHEILKKHSKLKIVEAKDGKLLEQNKIYIPPASMHITIQNDRLYLHLRDAGAMYPNWTVDIFLNSLAVSKGDHSLAVILSGTGTDGMEGARNIKNAGGLVIVQTPDSCEFDAMPLSVIDAGLADYQLLPEEMPDIIVSHVNAVLQQGNSE